VRVVTCSPSSPRSGERLVVRSRVCLHRGHFDVDTPIRLQAGNQFRRSPSAWTILGLGRRVFASHSARNDLVRGDPVFYQVRLDRFGASRRQRQIVFVGSNPVRVTGDRDEFETVALQLRRKSIEPELACRPHRVLPEIKQ
jgi:hypothetical protein